MTTVAYWLAYRCRRPTRRPSRLFLTVWVTPTGMKATTPLTSSSCKNTAADGPGPGGPAARPPAPYSPRLGLEIEMVVAHAQTGASLPVDRYFQSLRAIKQDRGIASQDIT